MQSTDDPQVLLFARDLARLNRLRRAYERLVPARLDTETPGVGEALVRDSTALFTDLRHFTRLMEGFADDPATVLRIVNEHLAVAVNAVTRCGGVVEKFVGDGLLATFGARTTQPDHRERAVAAAMAHGPSAGLEIELWDVPYQGLGLLLPRIFPPLGLGPVTLEDGSVVTGFLADATAVDPANDITEYGSWRAYLASQT